MSFHFHICIQNLVDWDSTVRKNNQYMDSLPFDDKMNVFAAVFITVIYICTCCWSNVLHDRSWLFTWPWHVTPLKKSELRKSHCKWLCFAQISKFRLLLCCDNMLQNELFHYSPLKVVPLSRTKFPYNVIFAPCGSQGNDVMGMGTFCDWLFWSWEPAFGDHKVT